MQDGTDEVNHLHG